MALCLQSRVSVIACSTYLLLEIPEMTYKEALVSYNVIALTEALASWVRIDFLKLSRYLPTSILVCQVL